MEGLALKTSYIDGEVGDAILPSLAKSLREEYAALTEDERERLKEELRARRETATSGKAQRAVSAARTNKTVVNNVEGAVSDHKANHEHTLTTFNISFRTFAIL